MDRRKLIVGAAAAVLALGGGGAAVAAQQGALPGQEDDPNITGTVSAPGGNEGAEGHENEAQDNEAGGQLEGLARIDRAAAEKAALGAVPGEVKETELENENGFVVYGVEIQGKDGRLHEVVVDAGNGKILAQELEDD
jgi:uncharacterized membrane protein YkoI